MNALLLLAQDDATFPLFFGGGLLFLWLILGVAVLVLWIWASLTQSGTRRCRTTNA